MFFRFDQFHSSEEKLFTSCCECLYLFTAVFQWTRYEIKTPSLSSSYNECRIYPLLFSYQTPVFLSPPSCANMKCFLHKQHVSHEAIKGPEWKPSRGMRPERNLHTSGGNLRVQTTWPSAGLNVSGPTLRHETCLFPSHFPLFATNLHTSRLITAHEPSIPCFTLPSWCLHPPQRSIGQIVHDHWQSFPVLLKRCLQGFLQSWRSSARNERQVLMAGAKIYLLVLRHNGQVFGLGGKLKPEERSK